MFAIVSLGADVPRVSSCVSLPALIGHGSCQQKSLYHWLPLCKKSGQAAFHLLRTSQNVVAVEQSHIYQLQLLIMLTKRHWATKSWSQSSALLWAPSQDLYEGFSCCTAIFWVLNLLRCPEIFTKRKSICVISTTWSGEPALYHMASWTLILVPRYVNLKGPCKIETSRNGSASLETYPTYCCLFLDGED